MGAKHRETRVFPGPIDYYVNRLRNIYDAGLQFGITGEQPAQNGIMITMTHGMTFSSWGEKILVTLTAQGNQTEIEVFSECAMPTQLFDLGKNKENVAQILGYLASGAPQPQQGYAQPQRQAGGFGFCPNCGNALNTDGAFCPNCGAKVK